MSYYSGRRRPGYSRQRRGGGEGNFFAWILLVASVSIVAGVGGWNYWQRSKPPPNPETMCPATGPTAVHAVLLDRSDVITPLQAQRIRQVFERIMDNADVGERIDLYVLAADEKQALAPKVSMCRPPSDGSMLSENPARIRERYINKFKKPLEDALTPMMAPATSPSSPIMESVKAVCVAAFGTLPQGTPAQMTIASDMIQFSPLLDHYRQRDFDKFASTPAYKEVLADCHHAKVDVLYLVRPRDTHVQDRRHQLFWEQFFDRENAVLMSMETI
jgi:hypothetical protein